MAHLSLVSPSGEAPPAPRRRRHVAAPALALTPDEAKHLLAAIRGLVRSRYGTLAKLAADVGVRPAILTRNRLPSPALAVAIWRVTKVPLDVLLSGKLAVAPTLIASGSGDAS